MSSPVSISSSDLSAQESFQSSYDVDNPTDAMTSYSRQMHTYTKRQLELATRSARRRTSSVHAPTPVLTPDSSPTSVGRTAVRESQ